MLETLHVFLCGKREELILKCNSPVMAARKVGQLAVDWAAIGAKFPQAIKADFNAFRARHEAIKAR